MAEIGNDHQSSNNEYVPIQNQFNDTLVSLMNETGYSMVQENGQRKFGGPPPNWEGPAPLKGSEVFVGKIPRDCFEDELVPVFSKIGKIYEMRLMMDFSGTNRGYAFVMYTCTEDAKKAIQQLNNYQIRPGKYIGVVKSVDNCRLFVGGIPKTKTREEIREEMARVTEGVVDVILYNSPRDKTKNRGFAFIEYESHRGAAIARRKLIPGRIQLFSQLIMVDWAEPEPEVDEEIMARVKVLYVRNLMEVTSEDTIREKFDARNPGSVEKVKKLRDFAFVHFTNREDAKIALNDLNGTELDGSTIEVTWAKPPDRSGRNREQRGNPAASYHNSYSNGPYGIESSQQLNYNGVSSQAVVSYPMTGRGSYGGYRSPIRGRGRGAAGLRGGRGFYSGGARHAEYRIYDYSPALIVPTNQVPMRQHKMPTQILGEFCQKHNLGEPVYHLISIQPHNNSADYLFNYKVVIPSQGTHQPREYHRTHEEAKQAAAHYTLMALGVNWDNLSGDSPSSPDTPPPPPSTPLSALSSNGSPAYSPVCFAKSISPPLSNRIPCAFNAVVGHPGRFKSCDMTPAYYGIPPNAYSISAATAAHY